ncbi:MAG: DUF5357 family protein [Limnospira sp. PMC 1291.21]|uniref:DUF5357 domain-containing protein n=3 Tax=Limnospira TaxID=2596745 RepID=A0A9P1P236_9CYAN|nr:MULTISPECIES: DUF5357 family protein [Limnospira]EKD09747.1 hypothetical protein SPLC1_S160300 [Arthrospira platensis C1]MDC0839846.1 DUF5357 family protein [Limnoraphis robusta]MDY7053877.1 DUF5357 family protein [Limnospira fusiformis LS22]QJB28899.1 DUF5357 domain-containing protein [Limnospira fusiformis SAG 85.79]EDZ92445.1 conserved hypothetical protein [Limnospira maxima CS-328]
MDNPLKHPLVKNVTSVVNTVKPPKLYHWKSVVIVGLLAWLVSSLLTDNIERSNSIANLSWILLTAGISWRTNQHPFIIRGVSLSPWITGTLITVLVDQETAEQLPTFAITVWPIICACFVFLIQLIDAKFKLRPTPPLISGPFLLLILGHVVMSCWISFYFLVDDWIQEYPDLFEQQIMLQQVEDFSVDPGNS